MKILITTDWYEPVINGVVTSVLNLVKELTAKGHDVRILTLSYGAHSYYSQGVYYIASISIGGIYPDARATLYAGRKMVDSIIRWHPDIIHSQCEFSSFQYAKQISRKLNIPIVHTYHTLYESYTHYFSPSKKMGKHIVSGLSRNLLSRVQSIIAPSEKIKRVLYSYRILRRIYVVPSGIDLNKFNVTLLPSERRALLGELSIPEGNKILITVGRLAKEKNVEQLIQYFHKMNRSDTDFIIVGGGPYQKVLMEYAEKIGANKNIHFTGMVMPQFVAKYYQLGDIFLCGSTSEAQGLTYMEAMASGLPCVCHKDTCLNGIVIDGKNGYQYDTYENFEKYINSILDNPELKESMSKNAKEITENQFSTKAFAEKIEKIYEKEIKRYIQ
ncbi:MAG: glycosyltransferase family 4 protein [Ruminococcaceae bacterium]|nr:glycosyltransferase family 4 protein [Oscillospiraceae bacterium]